MGGTTSVIDEFLSYTHVTKYRQYSTLDYSEGCEKMIADRRYEIQNRQKDVLFPKDMRIKVGYDTFSSARTFAVTLLDNKVAILEGGCSGGKPNSYGAPVKGVLPESKIRYRVSTRYFMRPDATRDDEDFVGSWIHSYCFNEGIPSY